MDAFFIPFPLPAPAASVTLMSDLFETLPPDTSSQPPAADAPSGQVLAFHFGGDMVSVLRQSASDLRGAARALRHASALSPQDGAHWNALGSVLHAAGHWHQAADAWRFALRQPDPDAGQSRRRAGWNLCQSLLLQGDMAGGWALHHHRPSFPALDRPPFDVPLLAGRPRHGHRILITVEQGLGDVIMVLRFIPLLLEAGVQVVLQRPAA